MSRRKVEKLREERALEKKLRVPLAEEMLVSALATLPEPDPLSSGRILCTTLGRGQFALAAAEQFRSSQIVCHFLDLYRATESRRFLAESGAHNADAIDVQCTADFPSGPFDLVAIPVDPRGEAELTRDLLQQAHGCLKEHGRLIAATGNPDDQWLHEELRRIFGKVTRTPAKKGVLYAAVRTSTTYKKKDFDCEFAFRDQGRLIQVFSRPGVFSHRSLDTGARALINSMEITPGCRFVDFGCGSGAVGFAAALRAPDVEVLAIDSNPRAVESTLRGAAANGITRLTAVLDDEGQGGETGSYDLVAGNPPYYSDYRIAGFFLRAARRLLKPGGRVHMVTKTPAWFTEQMPVLFDAVEDRVERSYHVVSGLQRG